MLNNDVLRRLRYALNITDLRVIELFGLAGHPIKREELDGLFSKEEEAGFVPCDDATAELFFKGLVTSRRGVKDEGKAEAGKKPRGPDTHLGNNEILRYIRIALELRDDDIIAIMKLAGTVVSRAEVNALFRNREHANYRPCGDQFLRNFLQGLTSKYRV
ncbi:MAG: DUF1456 family protein [Spirochaetota bacterium]